MSPLPAGKAFLVALNEGVAPIAEALVCDDLRGPQSLFGEGSVMPRPIRDLYSCCAGEGEASSSGCRNKYHDLYSRCSVLWESDEAAPPHVLARTIIEEGMGPLTYDSDLSLPAPTYLAGCSTSSFALAWKLMEDGYFPEWSSVLCSCQTQGRGQLRRAWHSPRGNLHVTFRLPDHPVLRGDAASLVTGYLLTRAFNFLGYPIYLKWPNDLLLKEKGKVGGILLEEKDGVVMAGLGVNISQAPSESALRKGHAVPASVLLPDHATLEQYPALVWRKHARAVDEDVPLAPFSLWKQLVTGAILEYGHSVARQGVRYVIDRLNGKFRPHGDFASPDAVPVDDQGDAAFAQRPSGPLPASLLVWKGKRVIVSDGPGFSGIFLGIGSRGGALLALDKGEEREFFSGSLSLA